jgi:hypothetical protein
MPPEHPPRSTVTPPDSDGPPAALATRPTPWRILGVWLLPVALQFVCWFLLFGPADPSITDWIRARNFLRAVVGVPSHVTFSLGLTDPNDLTTHAVMACVVWPVLLAAVTLSPARRLPLVVHLVCAFAWTFGGCCLFMAI